MILLARRLAVTAAMATAVLAVLVPAESLATHARPQGATPKYDSLVLYYNECTSPTLAHDTEAPKVSSCPSPTTSSWLTVGTPDHNSLPAQSAGSVRIAVCPVTGCLAPDVAVTTRMTDVRCSKALSETTPSACSGGAAFGAYMGSVETNIDMKITDHCNSPVHDGVCPAPPGTPATSEHASFRIITQCTFLSPTVGSTCQVSTTLNAQVPGAVQGGYRSNVESVTTIEDGGSDGDADTTLDNRRFATEGFFVP
jgi:hypothetical protein